MTGVVEGGGFAFGSVACGAVECGAVSFGAGVCEEAVEAELDMKSWIT
jgi:hypothetical protein